MKLVHERVKKDKHSEEGLESQLKIEEDNLCGVNFETKPQINSSVKTEHFAEDRQCLTCPKCDKQFANEYRLRKHRRQSIKCCQVDEANFVICEECGKDFANKYLLGYHMKTVHPSEDEIKKRLKICLLYTSPSPRDS